MVDNHHKNITAHAIYASLSSNPTSKSEVAFTHMPSSSTIITPSYVTTAASITSSVHTISSGSPTLIADTNEGETLLPLIGPLVGAIIGLGLLTFITLYCIQQMSKPRTKKETSWSSLNSIEQGPPPPVYTSVATPTPVKEKRLTADTLVDPSSFSMSMLKSQYSPQLALSPSLVAEELHHHQQEKTIPPVPNHHHHHHNTILSPSNTLIDPSAWMNQEKVETYDPQLKLDKDN
ncbi:hypothetical protein G6F70_001768 [Rhizopus microsporus]|uniref:Uncharacterized protein n=2 Tax=Rhizopus TaxID=4842 RepID=A0A367KG20_RHIAZ|nr:hypothetical protein G6F71_002382 [Rhizopus microsporus]RCI01165.1 hypothetical protein CU097_014012 [Rhizopus azygosporus]KAG1203025.1 hypothetical protein G6F70_001768 [Rhizopus microsporus]KAG1216235.1 hypothetical protein G6F69_000289 [Rhizopus microsporus]KAG1235791.1 hypothetical protein G6F67_002507 [Rhizopus microsporus]